MLNTDGNVPGPMRNKWPGQIKSLEGLFSSQHTLLFVIIATVALEQECGNGFKLKKSGFRLDIRKHIFTMRVVKHWTRLPRDAPSLKRFQSRLDGSLINLT